MALTKKQKQVYDFIKSYTLENGFSPTQVEIKDHFGLKSLGSVQDYIKYLKNSGHLISDANSVRGLKIVEDTKENVLDTVTIPLHGSVAAGVPIEAIETTQTIDIPAHMIKAGNHYALTVSGESMIEDGIFDGDTLIVKEQNYASNGETVIALIDNEATVKRYYKKSSKVELHPANITMKPIIIDGGEFAIKGVLVGLMRVY